MRKFKYKAKDGGGTFHQGDVEAADESHAAKLIRKKGLVIINISSKNEILFDIVGKFKNNVPPGEITNFTRQLSTMMNAGLPLTEALLILRSQSKGSLQGIVSQILADVEEGESLSNSMKKHPNAFSKTYVALVRSGEVGGVIDEVLKRLSDDLEKQQEFRGRVKGAMIYPIMIVLGMIGVAVVMFIFVIPRLTSLYTEMDVELPMTTKMIMFISDIMIKFWPLFLIIGGLLVWIFSAYRKTQDGRRKTDELVFKIPLVGDLKRQIILTDLTRTLSLMVASGVSIIEGMTIAAEVVRNVVISEALKDSTKMVEKGFPIAFAFSRHPEAFPFILSQMIAVGEETGRVDEVLEKISHVFEVESDQKVKAITAAVEPLILIVLGIGVAFLVVSVIMPIYNLTTSF